MFKNSTNKTIFSFEIWGSWLLGIDRQQNLLHLWVKNSIVLICKSNDDLIPERINVYIVLWCIW